MSKSELVMLVVKKDGQSMNYVRYIWGLVFQRKKTRR